MAAAVEAAPALGRKDLPAAWRVASRVLLVGAVLAVLGATLFDTTSGERILNLQPGAGIAAAFDSSRGAFGNIAGNVALFVPLGFLWAAVSGWSAWKVTASGVALSVLIEAAQYLTARRWADVDDVLLNGVGACLGAVAYAVVSSGVRRVRPG